MKAAIAGFNRIIRRCPNCKTEGAKELVGDRGNRLRALCPACNHVFNPNPSHWLAWLTVIAILVVVGSVIKNNNEPKAPEASASSSPASNEQKSKFASGPAVEESKRKLLQIYPEIGRAGSKMNAAYLAAVKKAQTERPEIFDEPTWPLVVAVDLAPKAETPPAAVVATAKDTRPTSSPGTHWQQSPVTGQWGEVQNGTSYMQSVGGGGGRPLPTPVPRTALDRKAYR